jgi:hypothetical protein
MCERRCHIAPLALTGRESIADESVTVTGPTLV